MNYYLLPCPFCGGRGHLEEKYRSFVAGKSERVALVRCLDCGARAGRVRLSDYDKTSHSTEATEKAVSYWNDRAIDLFLKIEEQKPTPQS